MTINVPPGKHKISASDDLVARTSQCVAVGIALSTQDLSGIAHIHFRNDHETMIDALIKDIMSQNGQPSFFRIALGGGVDAFVPGYGFVPGRANADMVIEYLIKNGFESAIAQKDLYEDYIRELFAYTKRRELEIKRVE
mgnify:CR=1 FL=1